MKNYIGLIGGLVIFIIILILPAPQGLSVQGKNAAAVVVLMSIWWIAGSIPVYVTAFIPLALYPVLKILPAGATAVNYGHNYVLMLLAGFIIAKGIENQNLHKRIALVLINTFGTSRRTIILSTMLATAFMSMWIANVTSALLMLPIALAIISKEEANGSGKVNGNFSKALMLSVAYSASIGGVGTLIGSPTNLILVGIMEKLFPAAPPVTFFIWLKIGMPVMLIFLPVVGFYLLRYFRISGNLGGGHEVIKDELKALGPMTRGERRVMYVFFLAVFGWVFREDFVFGNFVIPGWGTLTGLGEYVHDSTVAMFCAILLFMIPADKTERLMDWKVASQIPWGVAMIVGGGYAIAAGFKSTGLADWLGSQLAFISGYPFFIVLLIVVAFILFFSEVNSNTATVNIFLPVLASLAVAANSNPFILMIPATIAASFVFMMPAATGPNTVIYGSERITVALMAKCGLGLKLISLVLLTLILYFIVMPGLNLETSLPIWAK
ncbi:MAG: SLC13 family permease [Bacteroidales bacterium]|nr:SLC13 family permease [Bacteroidales bacterium]MCF8404113.1 SLC13 family permease [Bacteroidales bacterium]